MKRKNFIKNVGLSIGTLLASPISEAFSNFSTKKATIINLNAFEGKGNIVKFSGKFLDAKTLENISAKISIIKEHTNFEKIQLAENAMEYTIQNDLGNSFSEKLLFKIASPGYKTFEGQLVVNKCSVNINSGFWQYNSAFKIENKPNQHRVENGLLMANFDFHLVKL